MSQQQQRPLQRLRRLRPTKTASTHPSQQLDQPQRRQHHQEQQQKHQLHCQLTRQTARRPAERLPQPRLLAAAPAAKAAPPMHQLPPGSPPGQAAPEHAPSFHFFRRHFRLHRWREPAPSATSGTQFPHPHAWQSHPLPQARTAEGCSEAPSQLPPPLQRPPRWARAPTTPQPAWQWPGRRLHPRSVAAPVAWKSTAKPPQAAQRRSPAPAASLPAQARACHR